MEGYMEMPLLIGSGRINQSKRGKTTIATSVWRQSVISKAISHNKHLVGLVVLPALVSACAVTRIERASDLVSIATKSIEHVNSYDGSGEVVGSFELSNQSNNPVCLNEDVLINKLSPFSIVSYGNKKHELGVPYPPITSNITRIDSGGRREFKRVVGYAASAKKSGTFTVSVRLWDCNTSGVFVRTAKFVR